MFSKACEYGIRATLFIATESMENNRVGLKAIAKAIDSPEAFTAKILQQLNKGNIIHSQKGPNGGFEMTPEQLKTAKLSDIVKTIDGDSVYTSCGLGLSDCNEDHPCPVHNDFKSIRENLRGMLEKTLVKQLVKSLKRGEAVLKR